jgi:DNA-directed RNA polymerase subunit N (RpoN/RPB10)
MKINCLSCGFKVDLGDAYDDYEGQVKCYACGALLEIRTQEGNIRAVKSVGATLEIETQEGNFRAVNSVKVVPIPPVKVRRGL